MRIIIAGKPGCGLCEAAKKKFVLLGLAYTSIDLERPGANWRETDAAGAMAEYEMLDRKRMPLISIDGEWQDYPSAMRRLRNEQRERQEAPDLSGVAV